MAVDAWPAAGGDARRAVDDQFGALFDAHYLSLCRLAYVMLGDPARAEDVVQEAFLRTFAGWGRMRQALEIDVTAAVRQLPARQRETVVLRYFLDLSEAEIAATLGVNVGTVKSQLAKARRALASKGGLRKEAEDD